MEKIQDQHNIIINHILLIYKRYVYLSRNSESLKFIDLETKILEEKKAQNDWQKTQLFKKMTGYYVIRRLTLKV